MRKYDWSKDRVKKAVVSANCLFDCLDRLGIPKVGGNYLTLKSKIVEYALDTSHFDYRLALGAVAAGVAGLLLVMMRRLPSLYSLMPSFRSWNSTS